MITATTHEDCIMLLEHNLPFVYTYHNPPSQLNELVEILDSKNIIYVGPPFLKPFIYRFSGLITYIDLEKGQVLERLKGLIRGIHRPQLVGFSVDQSIFESLVEELWDGRTVFISFSSNMWDNENLQKTNDKEAFS